MKVENGKLIRVTDDDIVNGTFDFPNGIKEIGIRAFAGCKSLIEVNIPNTVMVIRSYAFADCESLERIHIPNTVMGIDSFAFDNCTSLKYIELPENFMRDPAVKLVFRGCNLVGTVYMI